MRTAQLVYLTTCVVFANSQENSCRRGFDCVKKDYCQSFLTKKELLNETKNTFGKNSDEFKTQLENLKDSVCNTEDRKVCCRNQNEKNNSTKLPDYNNFECGEGTSRPSKVVGGESTQLGEFPWMALLGIKSDFSCDIEWKCGGSIINRHYILSAAHCDGPDIIRVGEWRVDGKETDCMDINGQEICGDKPQDILPELILRHPRYRISRSTGIPVNDIMLVRLENPVKYSEFIKPVCLPIGDLSAEFGNFGEEGREMQGVVAGWGKTQDGNDFANDFCIPSEDQNKLKVPLIRNQMCVEKFQKLLGRSTVQRDLQANKHICASGEKGKDSCKGDSGGGLIFQKEDTLPFVQLGIISAGTKICGLGFPSLYTRVTEFMDWIVDNLE